MKVKNQITVDIYTALSKVVFFKMCLLFFSIIAYCVEINTYVINI